jgi:hypothetical protein
MRVVIDTGAIGFIESHELQRPSLSRLYCAIAFSFSAILFVNVYRNLFSPSAKTVQLTTERYR